MKTKAFMGVGGMVLCQGAAASPCPKAVLYGEVKCQNEIHIRIGLKTRLFWIGLKTRLFWRVAVGRVRVPAEGMPGG